jgi:polyisoprenoid-binding protein YceI
MKNIFRLTASLAVLISLFSFTLYFAPAKKWEVDKAHSAVTFSIKHMFTPVEGRFDGYEGEFIFDPENLEGSRANFTIEVASVNTPVDKRDNHLQSADFFNAEKYPKMKFVSTRFAKKKKGYVLYGKLTIKDVTKEVELSFQVLDVGDHPMMEGAKVMGIQAETTLNRNDYGVGTGSWAATMVVADEVKVKVNLEAMSK